jgi:hypothetical protein
MIQQKAFMPSVGHYPALENPFTTTIWLLYTAQRIPLFPRPNTMCHFRTLSDASSVPTSVLNLKWLAQQTAQLRHKFTFFL